MRTVIKFFFPLLLCIGEIAVAQELHLEERRLDLSVSTKWDVKGVLRTELLFYQKPSGLSGNSEFRIPYADVEILGAVGESFSLDVEVSHRQPVAAGENEIQITRAAAKLHPEGMDGAEVSVGLIETGAILIDKEDWRHDNLATELLMPAVRWGYTYESDYGIQLIKKTEELSWGLGVINGLGRGVKAAQAQKDAFLWADFSFLKSETRHNHIQLFALRGSYDNVPSIDSSKDRTKISIATRSKQGISFGAEMWSFRDPADSITGKVADSIDLSAFGGERVRGSLLSSFGSYTWLLQDQSTYEFFYRSDRLNPVSDDSGYNLTADNFGLIYSPIAGLEWGLLFSDTDYGALHTVTAREQQTWRISLSVSWD